MVQQPRVGQQSDDATGATDESDDANACPASEAPRIQDGKANADSAHLPCLQREQSMDAPFAAFQRPVKREGFSFEILPRAIIYPQPDKKPQQQKGPRVKCEHC